MKSKQIYHHFKKVDPKLADIWEKVGGIALIKPLPVSELFADLCRNIISQQLSEKAGGTLTARFEKLFDENRVTPQKVLALSDEVIRNVGPSWSKVRYIKNLAARVHTKKLMLEKLSTLDNETVIRELVAVKGIGPWTAEMFLMFSLGRENIFSYGDLGLKNAIKKLYGIKKITTRKLDKLTKKWSPYRTYAARLLWESLNL